MRTIFKYPLDVADEQVVALPHGAQIPVALGASLLLPSLERGKCYPPALERGLLRKSWRERCEIVGDRAQLLRPRIRLVVGNKHAMLAVDLPEPPDHARDRSRANAHDGARFLPGVAVLKQAVELIEARR